jgi:hypothetical protein
VQLPPPPPPPPPKPPPSPPHSLTLPLTHPSIHSPTRQPAALISLLLGQAQCFLALPGSRSCPTRAATAARCYRRALALEPTHAVALFRLGEALEAQQQFGAAKRFMSKAARSVRASGGDGGGGGAAAATPDVPARAP